MLQWYRLLQANRKQALEGAINILSRDIWPIRDIKRELSLWKNKDHQGRYKSYCGIKKYNLAGQYTTPSI